MNTRTLPFVVLFCLMSLYVPGTVPTPQATPVFPVIGLVPTDNGTGIGCLDSMRAAGFNALMLETDYTRRPYPEWSAMKTRGMRRIMQASYMPGFAPYVHSQFFQFQCDSLYNINVMVGEPASADSFNQLFLTLGYIEYSDDHPNNVRTKPTVYEDWQSSGYFRHNGLESCISRTDDDIQTEWSLPVAIPSSNGWALRVSDTAAGYAVQTLSDAVHRFNKIFCEYMNREFQPKEFIMRLRLMAKEVDTLNPVNQLRLEVWRDSLNLDGRAARCIASSILTDDSLFSARHQYHDFDLPFSMASPTSYWKSIDYQYLDFRVYYYGTDEVFYLDNIEVMDTLFRDELRHTASPGLLSAARGWIDFLRQDTTTWPEDPGVRVIADDLPISCMAGIALFHKVVDRILAAEGCDQLAMENYHLSETKTDTWGRLPGVGMQSAHDPVMFMQAMMQECFRQGIPLTPEQHFRSCPLSPDPPLLIYLTPPKGIENAVISIEECERLVEQEYARVGFTVEEMPKP